jgi:hypothetical protein
VRYYTITTACFARNCLHAVYDPLPSSLPPPPTPPSQQLLNHEATPNPCPNTHNTHTHTCQDAGQQPQASLNHIGCQRVRRHVRNLYSVELPGRYTSDRPQQRQYMLFSAISRFLVRSMGALKYATHGRQSQTSGAGVPSPLRPPPTQIPCPPPPNQPHPFLTHLKNVGSQLSSPYMPQDWQYCATQMAHTCEQQTAIADCNLGKMSI